MHQIEQRPALLDEIISVPKLRAFVDDEGDTWYEVAPDVFLYPGKNGTRAQAEDEYRRSGSWTATASQDQLTFGKGQLVYR